MPVSASVADNVLRVFWRAVCQQRHVARGGYGLSQKAYGFSAMVVGIWNEQAFLPGVVAVALNKLPRAFSLKLVPYVLREFCVRVLVLPPHGKLRVFEIAVFSQPLACYSPHIHFNTCMLERLEPLGCWNTLGGLFHWVVCFGHIEGVAGVTPGPRA
jgi:hypothetical protein